MALQIGILPSTVIMGFPDDGWKNYVFCRWEDYYQQLWDSGVSWHGIEMALWTPVDLRYAPHDPCRHLAIIGLPVGRGPVQGALYYKELLDGWEYFWHLEYQGDLSTLLIAHNTRTYLQSISPAPVRVTVVGTGHAPAVPPPPKPPPPEPPPDGEDGKEPPLFNPMPLLLMAAGGLLAVYVLRGE